MFKSIEATGKTLDLAIQAGLTKLQMDRDSVSVEVLEQPRSGFFGIGATPAKVKLTMKFRTLFRRKSRSLFRPPRQRKSLSRNPSPSLSPSPHLIPRQKHPSRRHPSPSRFLTPPHPRAAWRHGSRPS